ncbi:hypothetical protein C8R46DRAFT_1226633 [Mycena filopes]|nr:hypothetical protein C8R46DRAFT_1226633 [Mycena filopes]
MSEVLSPLLSVFIFVGLGLSPRCHTPSQALADLDLSKLLLHDMGHPGISRFSLPSVPNCARKDRDNECRREPASIPRGRPSLRALTPSTPPCNTSPEPPLRHLRAGRVLPRHLRRGHCLLPLRSGPRSSTWSLPCTRFRLTALVVIASLIVTPFSILLLYATTPCAIVTPLPPGRASHVRVARQQGAAFLHFLRVAPETRQQYWLLVTALWHVLRCTSLSTYIRLSRSRILADLRHHFEPGIASGSRRTNYEDDTSFSVLAYSADTYTPPMPMPTPPSTDVCRPSFGTASSAYALAPAVHLVTDASALLRRQQLAQITTTTSVSVSSARKPPLCLELVVLVSPLREIRAALYSGTSTCLVLPSSTASTSVSFASSQARRSRSLWRVSPPPEMPTSTYFVPASASASMSFASAPAHKPRVRVIRARTARGPFIWRWRWTLTWTAAGMRCGRSGALISSLPTVRFCVPRRRQRVLGLRTAAAARRVPALRPRPSHTCEGPCPRRVLFIGIRYGSSRARPVRPSASSSWFSFLCRERRAALVDHIHVDVSRAPVRVGPDVLGLRPAAAQGLRPRYMCEDVSNAHSRSDCVFK